jgi:hypothetical protein
LNLAFNIQIFGKRLTNLKFSKLRTLQLKVNETNADFLSVLINPDLNHLDLDIMGKTSNQFLVSLFKNLIEVAKSLRYFSLTPSGIPDFEINEEMFSTLDKLFKMKSLQHLFLCCSEVEVEYEFVDKLATEFRWQPAEVVLFQTKHWMLYKLSWENSYSITNYG